MVLGILTGVLDFNFGEYDLSGAQRVLSRLPPPKHYLALPRPDGSIVSLDQLFDPYVATIMRVEPMAYRLTWNTLMKVYAGQSCGQILQQFRGMTYLRIIPEVANGNDENLLSWAAYEVEHYHRRSGNQLAPLVPLETLQVEYEPHFIFAGDRRTVVPKWKILQDGLLGFSSSLNSLQVFYPRSDDGMVDRVFTIPRIMHKLKSLGLYGIAIDLSVWELAPNIENLDIGFPHHPLTFGSADLSGSQDDQNIGETLQSPLSGNDTIPTTTTAEQQYQRQLPEIWFHCPKLTRLKLVNQAINLFDPSCVRSSPNLQHLELQSTRAVDHEHAREARTLRYSTRWTWDWSFSLLHTLTPYGDLHEFRFSMAILRSCPALKSMDLHHRGTNDRFPLRAREILGGPLDKNTNQVQPFTHSNLKSITLNGIWDFERDELACLLQVLPGLTDIVLGSVYFDEGFGDRDLIEITKIHPALLNVATGMALTTEPLSALGLSPHTPQWRRKGAYTVCTNSRIPKERNSIIYTFSSMMNYKLRLS